MTRIGIIGPVLLVGLLQLPALASAQTAPEQPAPAQPAPEQPAPEQPAPEQPAPEQTATPQTTTPQPAIKDAEAARADVKTTLGFVPNFMQELPDAALPSAWQQMKEFQMSPDTELSPKAKELIGLAVAAQIPCEYCIYAHTEFAKMHGATEEEMGEALAMGALALHIGTFLSATEQDETKFRAEVNRWVSHAKAQKRQAQNGATPPQIEIVDSASALEDVRQTFGGVPAFIALVPPEALPGFWRSFKDVRFGETTLDDETKLLIAVAVSAQIPCEYCVIAQTEFAKGDGSTEAEINEAIAMAGLVRTWSTLLNGAQINKATFKKDVNRMVQAAKRNGEKAQQTARRTERANRANQTQSE